MLALGALGDTRAVKLLLEGFDDWMSTSQRQRAIACFGRMGATGIDPLLRLLKSSNLSSEEVNSIADALAALGPDAVRALAREMRRKPH